MSNIRYVKRHSIDEQKWNKLITNSVNSLPYAFSWYLDSIATWDAFILNDYEAVMPLVWMRKFGIKCLYQPYYCQQLGVFAKRDLTAANTMEFISLTTRQFPYVNINLNPSAAVIANAFDFTGKKNLLLDLNRDYEMISSGYSESHSRNISKAVKKGVTFSENVQLKPFQKFYIENVDRNKEVFKPKHAKIFKALTSKLLLENKAKIFAAVDSDENLLGAVLLIIHGNRLVAIINTSSAAGKQSGASPFVFDQIIRKYAGTNKVLDFEGSSIPGIARFYEGFGAHEEGFYNYKHTLIKSLARRFK